MKKLLLPILFASGAAVGCLSTTGLDPLTNSRNAKINATAQVVFEKAANVALQTVLNSAVSSSDESVKGNYLDGLASGFRSQEGNLLTASDVSKLVSIWTPSAPHWAVLGSQLAYTYAQANPQTPKEAAKVIESIASGLNTAVISNAQP